MIGLLPSWKNGAAKNAILDFVAAISAPGEDFVPAAERVAVFDNDGTLWCEQPMQAQIFFAQARAERLTEALDRAGEFGFRVVSMKNDWDSVYASDK